MTIISLKDNIFKCIKPCFMEAKMRKTYYFTFAVLLALFVVQTGLVSACTTNYVCADWSACSEGLQQRVCHDTGCGQQDITERRLCTSTGGTCTPHVICDDWTPCAYLQKTIDLFSNKISFSGIETRSCIDVNGCADNFTDEKECSDSYSVNFVKTTQCGETFITAVDAASSKPVSKISVNALMQKELNIAFLQDNFSYCSYCYDGVKDHDEEGVDCGGSCKACVAESNTSIYLVALTWIASFIFLIGFLGMLLSDRSYKLRFEFFKAYASLERKDIAKAVKSEKKIREIYSRMPYEEQQKFTKELDHFTSRLGDHTASLKKKKL